MTIDIKKFSKTKLSLISAMDEMLKIASIEDITIKALVKEAQITRSTFYTHYTDKNELFQDLISLAYSRMYNQLSVQPAGKTPKDYKSLLNNNYLIMLDTIYNNRHIFNQMNGRARIEASIKGLGFLKPILMNQLEQLNIAQKIDLDYFATYFLAGLLASFERWIVNDFNLSPEQMAYQLTETTYPMLLLNVK